MEKPEITNPTAIATDIAAHMTAAWNAGDGDAFAQSFTDDADFVTVFGQQLKSRAAIAAGHKMILEHIFKGKKVTYSCVDAAQIDSNTVLAHIKGDGALDETSKGARITAIIQFKEGKWLVRAFHNTTVSASPPTFKK